MRRPRHRIQTGGINIIPFLDILLVLVAVLSLLAETVRTKSLVINLPDVKQGEQAKSSSISISITSHGVFFSGVKVDIKDIHSLLMQEENKAKLINIEGDKDVTYKDIAFTLEQVKIAGFSNISLITKLKAD